MVIHQEKNTQIEQVAGDYARQLFEHQGYRITKGRKGCDFIALRKDQNIPVEVKGRSKLMNFTNLSKNELETLQKVPNARLILVYVDVESKPRPIIHLTLTKDDIASADISTYRIKWKVPIERAVMEELHRAVEKDKELIMSYKAKLSQS